MGIAVVFGNLTICEEVYGFLEEGHIGLGLYIESVSLMYGWTEEKLERNLNQDEIKPLKILLDGRSKS